VGRADGAGVGAELKLEVAQATLIHMQDVIPYKNYAGALEALDNGGRFYNIFTKARDDEVSPVELAKVAGVFSDKQKMFLFYEMAVRDLGESDKQSLFDSLSRDLQAAYEEHRPQDLLPSEADSRGVASRTAIITGYPRFVTDKTVFNGFIFIPISTGKSMSMIMIPIMDQYDIYELTDDSNSAKTFIANVRGSERLPVELSRFGGILKETSVDEEGKERDRLFLEALYYTRL
jgi:hypothetical protein